MKNLSVRNSKNSRSGLHELCRVLKDAIPYDTSKMIEIGSFSGDSARIFSEYFNTVICVDPWRSNYDPTGVDKASDPTLYNMIEVEAEFDKLLQEKENIVKYKESSQLAANTTLRDFIVDFVYIDSLHTYEGVRDDIQLWKGKIDKGGFIGGHDYTSRHFPRVKQAVQEITNGDIMTFPDSSWLVRISDVK